MLGWFKKKKIEEVPLEVKSFFNKYLGPTLLVAKVAKNISKYFKDVEDGVISFPAYKRKDSSVLQVWIDTRLELLQCLWTCYDNFNPIDLAEQRKQKELLAYINEADLKYVREGVGLGKYTLTATNPSKELKDMINVIIMMYETSLNISNKICVYVEVDKAMGHKPELKIGIGSLLTRDSIQELESTMGIKDFLVEANKISVDWLSYLNKLGSNEQLPSYPKTVFEIIFEDITKKSKIIALTAIWGPYYMANFMSVVKEFKGKGIEKGLSSEKAEKLQESFDYLINAKNPEEVIEWMRKRKVGPYREI